MLISGMTVFAHPANAQHTAGWVDAGGATLKQPNSVDRSAFTFGLGLVHQRGPWSLLGQGAVTVANDSVAATQAALRLSLAPARVSWSLTDIDVSTTTIGIVLPGNDGNQSAAIRQFVRLGNVQMFAGAGAGNTKRYQTQSNSAAAQLGATAAWRSFIGTAVYQRGRTDDWQLMEASKIFLKAHAPAYQLNDATVELSWRIPKVTITASQSWRAGFGNTTGTSAGGTLAAIWSPTPPIQLIAHGGRQLADLVRGIPQANYVGLTARWLVNARRSNAHATQTSGNARAAEARLDERDGRTEVVLRVDAPDDATVEVATSATEWKPQRLTREGSAFNMRLTLSSGMHRIAVRVNGGEWRAPRGLVAASDDFGGAAGLVVIP
jgi:hypothetical protein